MCATVVGVATEKRQVKPGTCYTYMLTHLSIINIDYSIMSSLFYMAENVRSDTQHHICRPFGEVTLFAAVEDAGKVPAERTILFVLLV